MKEIAMKKCLQMKLYKYSATVENLKILWEIVFN